MQETQPISTSRRVWAVTAIIISVLVLMLAASAIIGVWVGRSAAIQLNDTLMDGIFELADAGRRGASLLSEGVDEVQSLVEEVEDAVDEVAQSVADKGIILTLLPPEKEQKIVEITDSISESLDVILSAVEAAFDLYKAVDDIPLIDLPKPDEEKVQALEDDIQEIQTSVDQLASDIQAFRNEAAAKVGEVTSTAGKVNHILKQTSQDLSVLDDNLADLQIRANEWKARFRTLTAITAVVLSLIFIWSIYALVHLIMKYWHELQTY